MKLDEDMVNLLNEISAISGIQRSAIKEIWEYQLIYWAEKIAKNEGKLTELKIPFFGAVSVKYKEDVLNEDGTISTEIVQFVNASDSFKKLVGDIYDEKFNIIDKLLKKKIDNAIVSLTVGKDH